MDGDSLYKCTLHFTCNYGGAITIGGLAALFAFLIGFFINRPIANRMAAISSAIARAYGRPNESQSNEIVQIKMRITNATNYIALLLLITVISMAAAKYT